MERGYFDGSLNEHTQTESPVFKRWMRYMQRISFQIVK